MERWYVCGAMSPARAEKWNCGGRKPRPRLTFLPTVFIHCIRRADHDPDLHNHPWWARALILSGGYFEQRDSHLYTRLVVPGMVVRLDPDTFHRIDALLGPESWSLFIHGPKTQEWGFRSRIDGRFERAHDRYEDTNNG